MSRFCTCSTSRTTEYAHIPSLSRWTIKSAPLNHPRTLCDPLPQDIKICHPYRCTVIKWNNQLQTGSYLYISHCTRMSMVPRSTTSLASGYELIIRNSYKTNPLGIVWANDLHFGHSHGISLIVIHASEERPQVLHVGAGLTQVHK